MLFKHHKKSNAYYDIFEQFALKLHYDDVDCFKVLSISTYMNIILLYLV